MTDGCWGPDGERLAPYLRRSFDVRSFFRPGTGYGTKIGLVIRVHHKDASTNRSGSYAEYDVLLMDHLSCLELYRIPTMGMHMVNDSGDYAILRAASSLPEMDDDTTFYQNFMQSDGDLVVLEFIDGRFPMIIGTANHLRAGHDTAPWHTGESEGEVRVMHHKGSFVKMKEDGKLQIEILDEQEMLVTINGTQILKLFYDVGSGDLHIDLGSGAALKKVVLGETFQSWWNANVQNHIHDTAGGTLLDSFGGACTGTVDPALSAFPDANLSDKVRAY